MTSELVIEVDDLVGHLERERLFSGVGETGLHLGDTTVDRPMTVKGAVRGTVDGVHASYTVGAEARLTCVRCLTTWEETVEVAGSQHFARNLDEDGYGIVSGGIDMSGPARDELALALPRAPVCRSDCKGLCPICGTDLNNDPCDGHGEDSDSPFTILKDLFGSS